QSRPSQDMTYPIVRPIASLERFGLAGGVTDSSVVPLSLDEQEGAAWPADTSAACGSRPVALSFRESEQQVYQLHCYVQTDSGHGRLARASTSHGPLPQSAPSAPLDPCSAHPAAASPPRPSPR